MIAKRWKRTVWIALAAVAVVCSSLTTASASAHHSLARPLVTRVLGDSDFVFDGQTTYCWGVNANVSSSNVTDDLVFLRGSGEQCPLVLRLQLGSAQTFVNQSFKVTWTVSPSKSDRAIISLANTPALIDKRTRSRATIIHSNIHTCHFGSYCDPFRQGQTDTNATTNQIGNLSDATTFTTNEIRFSTPGKHVVLAHIIVPAVSFDARFDFAVFTTVEVLAANQEAGETTVKSNGSGPSASDGDATSSSSSSHRVSDRQIIVLSVVGTLLLGLFVLVMAYSAKKKKNKQYSCFRKRNDSDSMASKASNYCVHGSHMRTRSSDWTELYAIDDMLPTTVVGDEVSTIAIMRASRASTPNSSPSSPSSHDRKIADFRHDVARWDERSSASPITPSSSAILIAGFHDPDMISSTPANDCFVPLESLVLASPPPECVRTASPLARWKTPFRKHKKPPRAAQSPDDSGDETEVDI